MIMPVEYFTTPNTEWKHDGAIQDAPKYVRERCEEWSSVTEETAGGSRRWHVRAEAPREVLDEIAAQPEGRVRTQAEVEARLNRASGMDRSFEKWESGLNAS